MKKSIRNWPKDDRPREKLLARGAELLTEAELLALIIRTGDASTKRSALDLGRELIQKFGDLRALSTASVPDICTIKGTGTAKAASIKAALELAGRLKTKRLQHDDRFTSPQQVFEHYHYNYRDRRKEYFLALLLDGKNRVIKEVQISEGSLNQSIVHPREVFNPAVRESAAAIILVHNHPSGDPSPSREDIEITKRLREAGELMGVRVLDHIIIGENDYISFVSHGLM